MDISVIVRGGHPKDMTTVDPAARPGPLEAPPLLPCPWNVCSARQSRNYFQGHSLEREGTAEAIWKS